MFPLFYICLVPTRQRALRRSFQRLNRRGSASTFIKRYLWMVIDVSSWRYRLDPCVKSPMLSQITLNIHTVETDTNYIFLFRKCIWILLAVVPIRAKTIWKQTDGQKPRIRWPNLTRKHAGDIISTPRFLVSTEIGGQWLHIMFWK